MVCKNYKSPYGFQLNNERVTAYPHEEELLMVDGCQVFVLAVEKDIKIQNTYSSMQRFNGKTITIIYLLHEWNIYILIIILSLLSEGIIKICSLNLQFCR